MVKPKQPQADDVLIDAPVAPIPVVTPDAIAEVVPEAKPEVTPAAIAEVVPEAKPAGPVIEYVGEGAEKIEFTINPRAVRYVVNANGVILESF